MTESEKLAKDLLKDTADTDKKVIELEEKKYFNQVVTQVGVLTSFWLNIVKSVILIYKYTLNPLGRLTYNLFKLLVWHPFRLVWTRYIHRSGKFNPIRGAFAILGLIAYLFILSESAAFVFDAGLYMTTAKVNETVYMSNAQEILGHENIHSAQGCVSKTDKFSCNADSSLYFRINSSAFNQAWSLWNHHTVFYPDYIAASIAPGWEKCTITSYGFRAKLFVRTWDIYPTLLSATCEG